MKKNVKGFTLVELLAIIVILAIIAIITVPIILNVIENSRIGAIKNSAYGYKDSISKYYISNLSENSELKLQGEYKISEGKITGNGINNIEMQASGNVPKEGYLVYNNNILSNGCLVFEEYKVEILDGEINSVSKGNCEINLGNATHIITEGYATSKTLEITLHENNSYLLVKPQKNTTSNMPAIPCVENGEKYVCEDQETYTLENNKWYKFNNSTTLTLIENGIVSYKLSNGTISSDATEVVVDGIDRTPPEITNISQNCQTMGFSVSLEVNDPESDIEKYMYTIDNGSTWVEFSYGNSHITFNGVNIKYKIINKTYNNSGENEFNTTISDTYSIYCTEEPS